LRIIAGKLGGQNFTSPQGNVTHPMSDKIRGALFNILGDIKGLSVLDAFAGSGALSFEAISRGAAYVVAIDSDMNANKAIITNAKTLRLTTNQLKVVQANCFTWSSHNVETLFDIVIVDPPYESKRLNHRHVFKMFDNVKVGGLFVASLPPGDQKADYYASQMNNIEELVRKNYGDAQLVFYRRIA
jgi:16S rRNA (guanine(966)-N(2))-methyltransferase RsmD